MLFREGFPPGSSLRASDASPLRGASQLQPAEEEWATFLKRDTPLEKERRSCQREGKLPSARGLKEKERQLETRRGRKDRDAL